MESFLESPTFIILDAPGIETFPRHGAYTTNHVRRRWPQRTRSGNAREPGAKRFFVGRCPHAHCTSARRSGFSSFPA